MSDSYVNTEFQKIIDQAPAQDRSYAMAAAWVIAYYKGINLKVLNVSETSSLADYYVIGSVANPIQAKACAETIQKQFKGHQRQSSTAEGLSEGEWILLDFGNVIIHIFQEYTRDIYNLDSLWIDAPQEKIPHEFYYGQAHSTADSDDSYF